MRSLFTTKVKDFMKVTMGALTDLRKVRKSYDVLTAINMINELKEYANEVTLEIACKIFVANRSKNSSQIVVNIREKILFNFLM